MLEEIRNNILVEVLTQQDENEELYVATSGSPTFHYLYDEVLMEQGTKKKLGTLKFINDKHKSYILAKPIIGVTAQFEVTDLSSEANFTADANEKMLEATAHITNCYC